MAEWAESQAANSPLLVWTGRHLQAHRARLWLLEGDVEAASAWARELESSGVPGEGTGDESPYVREWEEIVLARLYLAEGRAGDAAALLERLSAAAQAGGRVARLLEILVLKVIAYDALGDSAAALQILQQAVELGKPQRFVRTFVEGGPVIERLLPRLLADGTLREGGTRPRVARHLRPYVASLIETMAPAEQGDASRRARRPRRAPGGEDAAWSTISKLTRQQRAIIRLIAEGASNEDIARALVITLGTAKRHVSNLYARLDVHSRTQAVARARALGYLASDEQDETPPNTDQ